MHAPIISDTSLYWLEKVGDALEIGGQLQYPQRAGYLALFSAPRRTPCHQDNVKGSAKWNMLK